MIWHIVNVTLIKRNQRRKLVVLNHELSYCRLTSAKNIFASARFPYRQNKINN